MSEERRRVEFDGLVPGAVHFVLTVAPALAGGYAWALSVNDDQNMGSKATPFQRLMAERLCGVLGGKSKTADAAEAEARRVAAAFEEALVPRDWKKLAKAYHVLELATPTREDLFGAIGALQSTDDPDPVFAETLSRLFAAYHWRFDEGRG